MNRRCCSSLWVRVWGWSGPECILSLSRDRFWEVLSILKFPRSPQELPHFRSGPGQADLVWPQKLSLFSRQSPAPAKGLRLGPPGRSWTCDNFIWSGVRCRCPLSVPPRWTFLPVESSASQSRKISFYTCQQINWENCFLAVIWAVLGRRRILA